MGVRTPLTHLWVVTVVMLCASLHVGADVPKIDFETKDPVPIFVNTINDPRNPAATEVYSHYGYCLPSKNHLVKGAGMPGSRIAGDRVAPAPLKILFKQGEERESICDKPLDANALQKFHQAINADKELELFVDGLSTSMPVGHKAVEGTTVDGHIHNVTNYYLHTHFVFEILHTGKNVIAVKVSPHADTKTLISFNALGDKTALDVKYEFSVYWMEDEDQTPWEKRMTKHQGSGMMATDIHWLSIVNAAILVVVLLGFLTIVLSNILKKDFSRYLEEDDPESGVDIPEPTSGWKQVRNDVFRSPERPMLFAAAIGNGVQILVLTLSILFLALSGMLEPGERGSVYYAMILLYAATAGFSGYVAGKFYRHFVGAKEAERSYNQLVALTTTLFAAPFFFVFCVANSVAIAYSASTAMSFQHITLIILLWIVGTVPITFAGAHYGKRSGEFELPTKTSRAHREIPMSPWYQHFAVQLVLTGFLPFTAIYIELHYVFIAVWGNRIYTIFGILFVAFSLLLMVTSFLTTVFTYYRLSVEDYHWWWPSLASGGSAGFFVFAYAIFFFSYRSQMNGVLQSTFFFGYVSMVSYGFFLMLASVGFLSSFVFVRYIYGAIKSD